MKSIVDGESPAPATAPGSLGGLFDVSLFLGEWEAHLKRLPASYASYINVKRVEDVLLHQKLLKQKDRPVVHVKSLEAGRNPLSREEIAPAVSQGIVQSHGRYPESNMEPWTKIDLALAVIKNCIDMERQKLEESSLKMQSVYEVTFSTVDKPNVHGQLSALLSNEGLHIREARVFTTTDGYVLDVFVVDGWPSQGKKLSEVLDNAVAANKELWSMDKDFDTSLLKLTRKIKGGPYGFVCQGEYNGTEVVFRCWSVEEYPTYTYRQVMEMKAYMPGGSLWDYLIKNGAGLELPMLLKFALDISKGMDYVHKMNVIHRDLKTANLLLDAENVVKVADFGFSRFYNPGDVVTSRVGTCQWMAPEILRNEPYDQRVDVYSFAIVLWELATGKVPYEGMTDAQATRRVRQEGLRPEIPNNIHPRLELLMTTCWDNNPCIRYSFSEITDELGKLHEELSG